jgi:hypothetical protein
MKINEILTEAPVADYEPIGDFEKKGQFQHTVDKKLVVHPTHIEKVYKFFQNTPYNFRFFPVNLPGLRAHRESGEASPEKIQKIFGKQADKILQNHENSITVVFLGNYGADRVMMTSWIMAHRFGHAIQATRQSDPYTKTAWSKAGSVLFGNINRILGEYYGISSRQSYNSAVKWDLAKQYSALFNAIGTQRSSRTGQINRPYEFLYELFAQYLQSGEVKLNPLPVSMSYGRKAWGRPTRFASIQPEYRDELSRAQETEQLAVDLQHAFKQVLKSSVGKIYLM